MENSNVLIFFDSSNNKIEIYNIVRFDHGNIDSDRKKIKTLKNVFKSPKTESLEINDIRDKYLKLIKYHNHKLNFFELMKNGIFTPLKI